MSTLRTRASTRTLARLYKTRDVIRYELIPMRFIKKVYHVRTYTQNDEYFSGKAPDAPFLNSQYDGSFIAGMAQLRYMYAMPVERIVKLFNDNGFDMDKGTAHGLLRKTERLFENLTMCSATPSRRTHTSPATRHTTGYLLIPKTRTEKE